MVPKVLYSTCIKMLRTVQPDGTRWLERLKTEHAKRFIGLSA